MEKPDNDPESIPSIFWRAHQERKAALRQALGLDPLAGVTGRPAGGGGVGVGAYLAKRCGPHGSSICPVCFPGRFGKPNPTVQAHGCPTFNPYCQDCIDGGSPEPTRAPDQWYSHASEQEIVEALVDCYRGGSWQEFLQRLRKRGLEVVKRRA